MVKACTEHKVNSERIDEQRQTDREFVTKMQNYCDRSVSWFNLCFLRDLMCTNQNHCNRINVRFNDKHEAGKKTKSGKSENRSLLDIGHLPVWISTKLYIFFYISFVTIPSLCGCVILWLFLFFSDFFSLFRGKRIWKKTKIRYGHCARHLSSYKTH